MVLNMYIKRQKENQDVYPKQIQHFQVIYGFPGEMALHGTDTLYRETYISYITRLRFHDNTNVRRTSHNLRIKKKTFF